MLPVAAAFAEPQFAEPQFAEPLFAEPQFAEPQFAEPQFAEPQFAVLWFGLPNIVHHDQKRRSLTRKQGLAGATWAARRPHAR